MIREAVAFLALLLAVYFLLFNIEVEVDIIQKSITLSAYSNYSFTSPDNFTMYYEITGTQPFDVQGKGCKDEKAYFSRGECEGSFSIFNKNSKINEVEVKIRGGMKFIDALRNEVFILENVSYIVVPTSCIENNDCGYDQGCVNLTCIQKGRVCDDNDDCIDGDECLQGKCVSMVETNRCGDGICQLTETIASCPSDCFGIYLEDIGDKRKAVFNFPYKNTTINIDVYINNSSYYEFKQRKRTYIGFIYGDMTYLDISPYIVDGYKDDSIGKVAEAIRAKASELGADEIELALLLTQSINYGADELYATYDDYPKYPVETIFEGVGDCEDTTILFASLLKRLGYESVLIYTKGHVGLGVLGNYTGKQFEYKGRNWFYTETTSYNWSIGEMPAGLSDRATVADIIEPEKNFSLIIDTINCTSKACIIEGYADYGVVKGGYVSDEAPFKVIGYNTYKVDNGRWILEFEEPILGTRIVIWVEDGGRRIAGPIYTSPISI